MTTLPNNDRPPSAASAAAAAADREALLRRVSRLKAQLAAEGSSAGAR